jgi:hypothetical protein
MQMPNARVRASAAALPAESPPSRRAALRLFAFAPALAIMPAVAMAKSSVGGDREILALSAEIQRIAAAADDISVQRALPFQEKFEDILRGPDPLDHSTWDERSAAASAYSRETGHEDACYEADQLDGQAGDLFQEMMAIPATTQAGRAAKVRAFIVHTGRSWRGDSDNLGYDHDMARTLLGDFAGMSAVELAAI